jgi:hypothetical protein
MVVAWMLECRLAAIGRTKALSDVTAVMHFRMTKRAYEQMLALMAGSDLRAQLSKSSN